MDDAFGVCGRHRFREFEHELCCVFGSKANALSDFFGEVTTVDIFQCEVRLALVLAEAIDLDDVRVLEHPNHFGFDEKASLRDGIGVSTTEDHLDRSQSAQVRVSGFVDDTHPTATQFVEQFVTGRRTQQCRSRRRVDIHLGRMFESAVDGIPRNCRIGYGSVGRTHISTSCGNYVHYYTK